MKTISAIILGVACLITPARAQTMNDTPTLLSARHEAVAAISAYTAAGDMPRLTRSLEDALDAGLGVNDIKEVLVQMYAYCGFPRSLNALSAFMQVVRQREARGIKDEPGRLPGPLPEGGSVAFGTQNQTKLTGAPVKGELFEFAPAIDQFLKGHLFGDIFARDNIDWATREVATIAALAAMKGTESQLQSHIRIGRHNGLGEQQTDAIQAIGAAARRDDVFPKGEPAPAHFSGPAWVARLVDSEESDMASYNVTFAPGVRNSWHSHSAGQILLCTVGEGYYQERGREARKLVPGDVVIIPADTEHWHGAAPGSGFAHIGITPRMKENKVTWGDPVTDQEYNGAVSEK